MTEEQLAEYETWAQAWSRVESAGARRVLELVAEVRRLRKELRASALDYLALEGQTWEQPAAVPPFPGILSGITAADVRGVQV